MVKYTKEIKDECVELAKAGIGLAEIARQKGPNPKAVARYCKAAGFELPKKVKAEKVAKTE